MKQSGKNLATSGLKGRVGAGRVGAGGSLGASPWTRSQLTVSSGLLWPVLQDAVKAARIRLTGFALLFLLAE